MQLVDSKVNKLNDVSTKEEEKKVSETSSSQEATEKPQREIPEEILKKIFRDLYPTNIHKTKYVNDNPSLRMASLTKGITAKGAKKEDIDDFLVKQVPKIPKSLKQLGVDWIESKKSLKFESEKLNSDSLTIDDIKSITKEIDMEDFETYCYLIQPDINDKVFDFIQQIKEDKIKEQIESGHLDLEKVKELESKIKELESKLSDSEAKQKEEMNSFRQNYEIEKEKLKAKYEQKIEASKTKTEEEKVQLVKIQAESDKRFSEERKSYVEQIESLEKENKKYLERINSIGSDLMNQSKQHKDANKSLTRIQNRIEELQTDNKELTAQNEELKSNYEQNSAEISKYKKQEVIFQNKLQELSLKIQELEKTKIAFLLNSSEIQSIIKEVNAVDETKERLLHLINIDNRVIENNDDDTLKLDDLWIKLIEQEENIIADYLSLSLEEMSSKDNLKEKIDQLLDLELNLKARSVLVKILYEKGYKAAYKED